MGLDWFALADNAGAGGADFAQFYSGMMQANREFMDLVGQRCRAYLELPHRVSKCKCPEDIFETEMDFFSEAQDHYKEFIERSLKGPFALPGALLEGPRRRTRAKSAQKTGGQRKGAARKKTTRRASKRGLFSARLRITIRNSLNGA